MLRVLIMPYKKESGHITRMCYSCNIAPLMRGMDAGQNTTYTKFLIEICKNPADLYVANSNRRL
jgi:hypothetical protein